MVRQGSPERSRRAHHERENSQVYGYSEQLFSQNAIAREYYMQIGIKQGKVQQWGQL